MTTRLQTVKVDELIRLPEFPLVQSMAYTLTHVTVNHMPVGHFVDPKLREQFLAFCSAVDLLNNADTFASLSWVNFHRLMKALAFLFEDLELDLCPGSAQDVLKLLTISQAQEALSN